MSTFHCKQCNRAIFRSEHLIQKQLLWDLTDYQAECYVISEAIDIESLRRYDCSLHEGWYCCQFIMMRMVSDKFGTGNHLLVYTDSVTEVQDGQTPPPIKDLHEGMIKLTHRDFDAVIQSGGETKHPNGSKDALQDALMVVKFGARWCPPCRLMDKVFDRIHQSKSLPNVTFFEVDIDEEAELASRWHFQSIPFTLFFKQGKRFDLSLLGYDACDGGLLGGATEAEFRRLCQAIFQYQPNQHSQKSSEPLLRQ